MIINNICKFTPQNKKLGKMGIINFVYEKDYKIFSKMRMASTYILFIICKNSGIFHTPFQSYKVAENDVILAYPSTSYYFESDSRDSSIEFSYISFISDSSFDMIKKTSFNKMYLVEKNNDPFLKEFWIKALKDSTPSNLDAIATAVLQYAFAILQKKSDDLEENLNKNDDIATLLKKRIDEAYSDQKMNLNNLAREFGYSPNYLSSVFEKKYEVPFSKYINTLRLNKAQDLIIKGLTSVKQISSMCGFSDPFYFSKKFKEFCYVTPSEYMKKLK